MGKAVEAQDGAAEVFETVVDRFREAVACRDGKALGGDHDQHGT